MIVNLIKSKQMFSLTLPNKIKGQYWLTDTDSKGHTRELISIEALNGAWVLKSNKRVFVLNANNQPVENTVLQSQSFFNLKIKGSDERVILFAEKIDSTRNTFRKVVVKNQNTFYIGRTADNNFCYFNKFASGKHARISYDGRNWNVTDLNSTNGTYVNGYRVESRNLLAGDVIYIMGLKIIVGCNFLAVNNPDGLLKINSQNLFEYSPQRVQKQTELAEIPEKEYFYRSPRFRREIEHTEITIDPPPQLQKMDTVPLALMLGPSITMGMTSLSTGLLTLNNVLVSG